MSRRVALVLASLALVLLPLTVQAAPPDWRTPKPLGLDVVGFDGGAIPAICRTGSAAMKFRIERWIFGTTAEQVEAAIAACGLRLVVLHAGVTGYDWRALAAEWHAGGWGALVNRHPEVRWWLEVGNEPEFAGMPDGFVAREATLRTYKTLALGIGSGEPAWRDAYPRLLWLAALPLTMERVSAFLAWVPDNRAGWINQGAVADWYDGVAPHVYGYEDVTDTQLWTVYNWVVRQPGVRACVVTEAGTNGLAPPAAMDRLAGFARWTPCEAVLAFAWFPAPCDWGGAAADAYHLCDGATLDRIRAYNRSP